MSNRVEIIDFDIAVGAVDGLVVVTPKQVTDRRGTIREVFRASAFEQAGITIDRFRQINLTETRRGAVRGMHAEAMTKLLTVASGAAHGAYVDLRAGSPTFGAVDRVDLRPGVQILVPPGVANGFQALVDGTQYLYCFDREWAADMDGLSCSPLDPDLDFGWPLEIDPDDDAQLSAKDRTAPSFASLAAATDSVGGRS